MTIPTLVPTYSVRVAGGIHSIALAADGRRVAVAADSGLFVHDHHGQRKFAFYREEFPFGAVAMAPSGESLLALAQEGYLYSFALSHDLSAVPYETLHLFAAPKDLRSLSITPDARWIALGHVSDRVTLVDCEGKPLWSWQPQFRDWHVALAGNCECVLAASMGSPVNAIYALDGQTGTPIGSFFRTSQRVTALVLLPGGAGVVAALSGGEADNSLFMLSSDLRERQWAYGMPCIVTDMASDEAGRYLAVGGSDGLLYLFDLQIRQMLVQYGPLTGPATAVAIVPSAQQLAVAGAGYVHLLRNELAVPDQLAEKA